MRNRPRRIALLGNFGSDNLGNEASFKSLLDFIRGERPNDVITGVCYGPDRAHREHHVDAIPLKLPYPSRRWFNLVDRLSLRTLFPFLDFLRALRIARRFDVFMVPGTGILDDFSERWQAMPYDLFKWGLAARLAGRPLAFISVGAGPIRRPLSRWLMVRAVRMAAYRSYRDEASRKYMLGLDAGDATDQVYPDIVFALPSPSALPKIAADSRPTIGVGVMQYHGWDRYSDTRSQIHDTYESQMVQFIFWLIDNGYRVRLLMGADSDKASFANVSARVADRFGKMAGEVFNADSAATLDDLMRQIQETELIVATRFHNIVAALLVGKVAISVGYADKNVHLLARYGLDRYSQHAEQLDVAQLIVQFSELMKEKHRFEGMIGTTLSRDRDSMRDQYDHLLRQFL